MGRRGPKPTPTAVLKLRGSFAAGRRVGEPELAACMPDCPDWVLPSARKHWGEISERIAGLGVMALPHTVALSLLVDALARWIMLSKLIEKAKPIVRGSMGNRVPNPLFKMQSAAWEQVIKICREFGMTPSAATSVRSVSAERSPAPAGLEALRLAK